MILGYLLAYLSLNPPIWVLGGFGSWPGAYLNRDCLAVLSALLCVRSFYDTKLLTRWWLLLQAAKAFTQANPSFTESWLNS